MIEFSIEGLVDVNIAMVNGAVVYLVNGESVPSQDFTAIMSAVQVLFAFHAAPDDEEEDGNGGDEPIDPSSYPPPFGG